MKTIHQVLVTIFVGLSAQPFMAAETPDKPSYEQYLRDSADFKGSDRVRLLDELP